MYVYIYIFFFLYIFIYPPETQREDAERQSAGFAAFCYACICPDSIPNILKSLESALPWLRPWGLPHRHTVTHLSNSTIHVSISYLNLHILAPPWPILAPSWPTWLHLGSSWLHLVCILAPWGPFLSNLFYYLRMSDRFTIRCEWMPKAKECVYFPLSYDRLLLLSWFFVIHFSNDRSSLKCIFSKIHFLLTKKSSLHDR